MPDPEFDWWRSWISVIYYQYLSFLTHAFVVANWAALYFLYHLS